MTRDKLLLALIFMAVVGYHVLVSTDAQSRRIDAAQVPYGPLSERPPAGIKGRIWVVTDANGERICFDNGSDWVDIGAGLTTPGLVPTAQLGFGTANSTTYLRGDRTWAAGGGGEANTASNLGGGLINFDSKSGVDLRFNTFNSSDFSVAANLLSLASNVERTTAKNTANGYAGLTGSTKFFAAHGQEVWASNDLIDVLITSPTAGQVLRHNASNFVNAQLEHADLTGIGADDHHSRSHVLADTVGIGADHTVSGLSIGQYLRATGATTARFQTVPLTDLGSGTPDASNFLRGDGTWAVPTGGGGTSSVKLGSDLTTTSTSFGDATGLSFSVSANTDYLFEFHIIFRSAATTTGIALAVNGPSGPAAIVVQRQIPTSLTAVTMGQARAYNSGAASSGVDVINADNLAILQGILRNGANSGTVILRFASEVAGSTVTVRAGSMARWQIY
jgi:hypothetical protein